MKIGIYRHYKGKLYEVMYVAKHTETLEELVVYKAMYDSDQFGNNAIWVRPKNMFLENIEFEGRVVPRFEYIGNKKYKNV
nr:DUF1653 domain-containing protein [Candidatus Gracilibacteria bacterium]